MFDCVESCDKYLYKRHGVDLEHLTYRTSFVSIFAYNGNNLQWLALFKIICRQNLFLCESFFGKGITFLRL